MSRNDSSTATQPRHSATRRRISQKAYDRFVARIKDVYSGYIMDPAPMLRALDAYLDGNRGAHYSLPPLAHLAFLVLRQDIDAAIERSRAARERARLRREAKMKETATDSPSPSDPPPADNTTPQSPPETTPQQTPPTADELQPLPEPQPSTHTAPLPDTPAVTSPPNAPATSSPSPKKRIKCHNRHARRVSPRIFMQLDHAPCKR